MARYNIKSKYLAAYLDISPNAVSTLRKAKTMPRLDGLALTLMCNALNKLCHARERNHNKIIVETRLIASLRDVVIMGNQPDMILAIDLEAPITPGDLLDYSVDPNKTLEASSGKKSYHSNHSSDDGSCVGRPCNS